MRKIKGFKEEMKELVEKGRKFIIGEKEFIRGNKRKK